jgi:hypothetical protein
MRGRSGGTGGSSLGGRAKARQFFLAARARSKRGALEDARLLYELAYEASKPRTPSSVFLNLGLLAREEEDLARAKACLRAYVARRKTGPEVSRVRSVLAALPGTRSRRCVTAREGARARERYARSGARIEAWVDEALAARLR